MTIVGKQRAHWNPLQIIFDSAVYFNHDFKQRKCLCGGIATKPLTIIYRVQLKWFFFLDCRECDDISQTILYITFLKSCIY